MSTSASFSSFVENEQRILEIKPPLHWCKKTLSPISAPYFNSLLALNLEFC